MLDTGRDGTRSPLPEPPRAELTGGLGRNTLFNVIGWGVPVVLYLIATPVVVRGLGTEVFGVFGIVSVAAGYFAFLNTSTTTGNIRFLAEAYGQRSWVDFRDFVISGLAVAAAIGAGAGLLIAALAPLLAVHLFRLPDYLVPDAVLAIRLAGAGFLVNSLVGALSAVPAAVRRYDLVNAVNIVSGVGSTLGVALVVLLGFGLVGAVLAQVLSSVMGLIGFAAVSWWTLRRAGQMGAFKIHRASLRRIFSFSAVLSFGQIGTTIGLQIDRTVVAALLGPTAVTFYTIPQRIADQLTGLLSKLATTLLPLAAEGSSMPGRESVRHLYLSAVRTIVWLAVVVGVPMIGISHDLLLLWLGPEFAQRSTIVLIALIVVAVFRSSAAVASPVCIGLGRADAAAVVGWALCISFSLPVFFLARLYGIEGAAIGCIIGIAPLAIGFDLFVQRRLLGQRSWATSLLVYAKPFAAGGAVLLVSSFVPVQALPPGIGTVTRLVTLGGMIITLAVVLERPLLRRIIAHLSVARQG